MLPHQPDLGFKASLTALAAPNASKPSPNPQEVCESSTAAKDLFEKASDILGYNLLDVCTEGEFSHWHSPIREGRSNGTGGGWRGWVESSEGASP